MSIFVFNGIIYQTIAFLECLLATFLIKLELVDVEFQICQHYYRSLDSEEVNMRILYIYIHLAAWMEQWGQSAGDKRR